MKKRKEWTKINMVKQTKRQRYIQARIARASTILGVIASANLAILATCAILSQGLSAHGNPMIAYASEKETAVAAEQTHVECPETMAAYQRTCAGTPVGDEPILATVTAIEPRIDYSRTLFPDVSLDNPPETENLDDWAMLFLVTAEENGGAGLTKAGAAAILGCIEHESDFNCTAENKTDGGYGLLQWTDTEHHSRKQALITYCNENGLDYNNIEGQLKFFIHELYEKYSTENGYKYPVYETLKQSNNVEECLEMFFCHAEAGTNVKISTSVIYTSNVTTQELYDSRLATSYLFYHTNYPC